MSRQDFPIHSASETTRISPLVLSLFFLSPLLATSSALAQLVVSQTGGGTHTTIQSAINSAADGMTITVLEGTYNENINFLGKSLRLISFNPDDPEIVEDTVIAGIAGDAVISITSGESSTTTLEGFTITQGLSALNQSGAGIRIGSNAAPTIRKNVIFGNFSQLNGGGVAITGGASPRIEENTIFSNIAEGRGAGIFVEQATAEIRNNKIFKNFTQDSSGGAIHLGPGTSASVIVGNDLYSNIAVFGGGVHLENSKALVARNRIYDNQGAPRGGGISLFASDATIENNLIAGNSASIAAAIDSNGSKPIIRHNTIIDNRATSAAIVLAFNGSQLDLRNNIIAFHNQGIAIQSLLNSTVAAHHNCLFANSTGDSAGAVTLNTTNIFADPMLIAPGDFQQGGTGGPPLGDTYDLLAMLTGTPPAQGESDYKFSPDRKRFRVEITGFPPNQLQKVFRNGQQVAQFTTNGAGFGSLEYDTNDGNYPPNFPDILECDEISVNGIASGNMELEDIGSNCDGEQWVPNDEHLQSNSPCRMAGDPTVTTTSGIDIDQQIRQYGAAPDIGFDEFIPAGSGDFNGDGMVDLRDLADAQTCFIQGDPLYCIALDFGGTPGVNLADIKTLLTMLTGP